MPHAGKCRPRPAAHGGCRAATDVTFTAHLGTTYKNRVVEIWADPYGPDKPKKLVKKGTVNSSGNLSVKLHLTRDTALSTTIATTTMTYYKRGLRAGPLTGTAAWSWGERPG